MDLVGGGGGADLAPIPVAAERSRGLVTPEQDAERKAESSKHHPKSAADICMLELLNVVRPIRESCFSEQQIDMLFNLWREFMIQRFKAGEDSKSAREDVDRLFSNATSVSRKYNALRLDQGTGAGGSGSSRIPAIGVNESLWVMGDESPTPFIAFLRRRPQVMDELRMSFKPLLTHTGMLESTDFVSLLVRYIYWLKNDKDRALNVIGVVDDSSASGTPTDAMVGNLQKNWTATRFHLAVMNESSHWRAVLIDRTSHTFEYYDPKGSTLDIAEPKTPLADQVGRLYEAARTLDPGILTKSMHIVNRGFNKHQSASGGAECGMYVVLFIHTRVAQVRTFEEFSSMEIAQDDCRALKNAFFTMPEHQQAKDVKTNKDYRLKFGDYDIRLAALDFSVYMAYLISILTRADQKQRIADDQAALLNMVRAPGDYVAIRVEGVRFQKDVLSVLPPEFMSYAGSDIWFSIIQEIVQDPLTKHLRKISSGEAVRSKNTVRKKIAMKIFNDIVGWSWQLGAPPGDVEKVNALMRQSIDQYYVNILSFDPDNKKRFETGMQPIAFVRECMARQDTVSFGVHFLRKVYSFVVSALRINVNTELNTKYPLQSVVTRPVTGSNIDEIRTKITACDRAIQQAYNLLRTTFTERMMITDQVRSPTLGSVSVAVPMQVEGVQPELVEQIAQMNKKDFESGALFSTGGLEPYNFPLNVAAFQAQYAVTLPEKFFLRQVNQPDMRRLLSNDTFMLYFGFIVTIVTHYAKARVMPSLTHSWENAAIMFESMIQMLTETETFSEKRKIICTLMTRLLRTYLEAPDTSSYSEQLRVVLERAKRYSDNCVANGDVDVELPYFKRIRDEFAEIKRRKMAGQA